MKLLSVTPMNPSQIKPRDYQEGAIDGLFEWWKTHLFNEWPLVVLPTASGKTIVFSMLIHRILIQYQGVRVLILAHRKELISQAEEKLLSVWPTAPIGVYSAGIDRREINKITIASRQTIANVVDALPSFDIVIVDEAHNIGPKEETQYRKILDGLKEKQPRLTVVGFTATPYRATQGFIYGEAADHLFHGVAFEAKIKELMDKNYLCRVISKEVVKEGVIHTDDVNTTAGDFNQGQLAHVAEDESLVHASVKDWHEKAWSKGRQSHVFYCVSVIHAKLVQESIFEQFGLYFPILIGTTPSEERDEIIEGMESGELQGVINVGVLTEGWDCPRLDCIVLLRPTKSLVLYMQMVGRGLRLFPGKENTLVLDYGECIQRFGPIDLAQPVKRGKKEDRTKTCPQCGEINGAFKRKCVACGFQFEENPVKVCPACDEPNAPSAAKCIACGHPFFNHTKKAHSGGIISNETSIKEFDVEGVTMYNTISVSSGKEYLVIAYSCSIFETFYKNLFIGYDGPAGQRSLKEWRNLVKPKYSGVEPQNPEHCMRIYDAYKDDLLKPVVKIHVDMSTKFKDIIGITFGGFTL